MNGLGSNRVVLITGGARRIGRALALDLARIGYRVGITYRKSKDDALRTVSECRSLGVDAEAFRMEICSEAEIAATAAAVLQQFGRVDALVNNAAVFDSVALEEMTAERWDATFAVNVRGPMLMTQALLPQLRAGNGRVVHIGSLGGSRVWPTHAHYCSAKAALEMLTRTMARAYAPEVSVNCVAPGWIQMEESESARSFASRTPMCRNGSAEDVAAAVRFFLTGPAFITGQVLAVDGGLGLI
jgi:3-oxoacyl-[acyl-carrier protein] reductase/pteridine reductase